MSGRAASRPTTAAPAAHADASGSDDDADYSAASVPHPEPEQNAAELFVQPFCVGTLGGVRIWVHPTLPIATACFSTYAFWRSGLLALAHSLVLHGPSLWGAALLHELCHCWAARALGVPADTATVIIWPFGGLTSVGRTPSMRKDIAIALAGPLSHAVMAGAFAALFLAVADGDGRRGGRPRLRADNLAAALCFDSAVLHVLLLVANLALPAFPLDGGRILADVLVATRHTPAAAAAIIVWLALASLLALAVYAIVLLATAAPGGVLLGVTAVWMAISTKDLDDIRLQGAAHLHPLFALPSAGRPLASDIGSPAGEPARNGEGDPRRAGAAGAPADDAGQAARALLPSAQQSDPRARSLSNARPARGASQHAGESV
ncbi:hypothetical protein KFE25_008744 [Diacronema lutheri]|uniref:Peptidase M50 domain-containing protein n=1 Tax=Diacronema lutheri TaxID=2081491 RepID=A0A7R9UPH2_DIALT|nr:hypothetical protein KFE25_008744 [Diacronema lutheri]